MKSFYIVLLLTFTESLSVFSQKHEMALYKYRNIPYAGDSIVKQQMEYANPGAAGKQVTWDFRNVRPVNDEYVLLYKSQPEDTAKIVGIEHRTIYRYQIQHDSLLHTGYENATTYMEYTEPELQMKYPFHYGDTIHSHFKGIGEYSRRIPLNVEGSTTITADAIGTLYTPDGLELKNVLRIKKVRDYTETGVDSVRMQLITYSWYAWGSRYPVFETVKTTTKKTGKEKVEHRVASFFFHPAEQATIETDSARWEQDDTYSQGLTVDDVFTNCKLLPNPVESDLYIDYDLTQDAAVSFSLHDVTGIAKITTASVHRRAGHYREHLQLSGFQKGIYPLYATVNGMVKTLHVLKK